MASRTWIKIYCDKWLSGSLREENPELRGIWADLLALAGSGLYGDVGEIRLQNGIGLTDFQFQKLLNISKYQWRKSKKRLLDTQRITISDLGAIRIINWKRYQSEYERQKPYRNRKLQPVVTQEKEKEIEIENNDNDLFDTEKVALSDSLKKIITYYFKAYREHKGEPHPDLKIEQWQRVVAELEAFCVEFEISDLQDFRIMIDYHFQRKLKTDYNINHFATKGILENLFYKKLY